ncbi:MAG: hydrogenase expression/formation protein HypE [Synergistales bacterium]|nr:hydrogenase expression/formation protein HypE [Synergistales bacterium]
MEKITLGHGSGGRLTQELIGKVVELFPPQLVAGDMEDCTFIDDHMAMTIDSFTVTPRTFPGGDIGKLAICGSANDLAVRGIAPENIAMSLVIEEGFELEELKKYMRSAAKVCQDLGLRLTAGDTKVVPAGALDGLFITTCSVGRRKTSYPLGMNNLRPGDKLMVTTSIGQHGATIGAERFNLSSENLRSDCGSLWSCIQDIIDVDGLRCLRDCTRGGLGTALCEWAEGTGYGMEIEEVLIPLSEEVSAICDILGFDPLYLACEGCALIGASPSAMDRILARLRNNPISSDTRVIGEVVENHGRIVGMKTLIGGMRIVDMPVGEMLPRIC